MKGIGGIGRFHFIAFKAVEGPIGTGGILVDGRAVAQARCLGLGLAGVGGRIHWQLPCYAVGFRPPRYLQNTGRRGDILGAL